MCPVCTTTPENGGENYIPILQIEKVRHEAIRQDSPWPPRMLVAGKKFDPAHLNPQAQVTHLKSHGHQAGHEVDVGSLKDSQKCRAFSLGKVLLTSESTPRVKSGSTCVPAAVHGQCGHKASQLGPGAYRRNYRAWNVGPTA